MQEQTTIEAEDGTCRAILDGAERCFARFGGRKTSMSDIAKAAGVGRQTLYRRFGSKEQVIEAFFVDRVARFADLQRARLSATVDLEDQIVDTFVGAVRLVKSDEALANIIFESDSHDTELFLIGAQSPLHLIATNLWMPILEIARSQGRLRQTLTFDQAVQCVRALHLVMHLRTDFSEREQMHFARTALLPILLLDSGNKYCG